MGWRPGPPTRHGLEPWLPPRRPPFPAPPPDGRSCLPGLFPPRPRLHTLHMGRGRGRGCSDAHRLARQGQGGDVGRLNAGRLGGLDPRQGRQEAEHLPGGVEDPQRLLVRPRDHAVLLPDLLVAGSLPSRREHIATAQVVAMNLDTRHLVEPARLGGHGPQARGLILAHTHQVSSSANASSRPLPLHIAHLFEVARGERHRDPS